MLQSNEVWASCLQLVFASCCSCHYCGPCKEHGTSLINVQLAQPLLLAAKASNPFTHRDSFVYRVDATELSMAGTVVQALSEFISSRNKR